MKIKKFLILFITLIIFIGIIALGFTGNYFYNLALNPDTPKDMIFGESEDDSTEVSSTNSWLLNHSKYTDEYITSFDNLKLHSYKLLNENPSNKWAIVVHGYTSEGLKMSSYAKNFYNAGYNIIVPDLRAHGLSEGNYIGMGWDDRFDIISWINYVLNENSNSEIVLFGVSMGASTVAMTSGEELPSNIKAIIADCGYTSVWNEFSYQLDSLFSLPEFPVMNVSSLVSKIRAGYSLKEASAIEQVKKSKTPILYIHGDKDDFVPTYMVDELYNATTSPKEKLIIKGAGHALSSSVDPYNYWNTVFNFINKYI